MAVTTSTLEVEIGGLLVAIFVVLLGVYALYRYLRKRGPDLAAREGRSVLEDRAYNQIRLGQAAADHLARSGTDVGEARELLRRAEVARAGRSFQDSIELSKKAQDRLAATRTSGSLLTSTGGSARSAPLVTGSAASPGASKPDGRSSYSAPPDQPFVAVNSANGPEETPATGAGVNRPPKNKLEARFQLNVGAQELEEARASKSGSPSFQEAEALHSQGQLAFDKEDFTEALRLALKSRRTLGARIEALPVTAAVAAAPTLASAATARSASGVSEALTFGPKCSKCGRVAAETDQFCRTCGTPIVPVACSSCGTPLLAGDRFCGKCGATQG